jgi:serine phosphatase RsbU (regulator of sigma subunit)
MRFAFPRHCGTFFFSPLVFFIMKIPFLHAREERALRKPAPSRLPQLETASIAALYRAARTGGDFFDFEVAPQRLVFMLADIAGRRDEALHIAATMQEAFQSQCAVLFPPGYVNDADALSALCVNLNRAIMQAAEGVRCAPAFLATYDEDLGTIFYINAGHTSAILKDHDEVTELHSHGIPLGLFTHVTYDAQTSVLPSGGALLLASKGLVESRARHRQEFGIERLRETVQALHFLSASELCSGVLSAVEAFTHNSPGQNDITTLAVMRSPHAASAPALS